MIGRRSSFQPRHLPPLWSVQHQEERLGVKAADNRIDAAQYELATRGTEDTSLDLEAYRAGKHAQLGINPHRSSFLRKIVCTAVRLWCVEYIT